MVSNTINIDTFCAVQGVNELTEFCLNKIYKKGVNRTYSDWYELLKSNFELGNKKSFE